MGVAGACRRETKSGYIKPTGWNGFMGVAEAWRPETGYISFLITPRKRLITTFFGVNKLLKRNR